ncbi:hypothetical protein MD484_g3244, partial [Candolleomyces efflorescens]
MSIPFSHGRPLPVEILEQITHELVKSSPLGPPSQIIPLLLTSRAVNQALSMHSGTPLYSHICRFKFDVGAVSRRAFTPGVKDLNGHLVQMCNLLRFIRRNDIDDMDVEDQLLIAYVAMLDSDGKNRAQLQHAGIEAFVDRFVRKRLWVECESNDGWPLENVINSCALWLMWMFTTKAKLDAETVQQREELIQLVFPYISCPLRYPCALVPPNHFTLPLGGSNAVQTALFTSRTAHGPYPLYHIIKNTPQVLYYYRGSPTFLPPLITPVAKLLYWCRRERTPFFNIPQLPPTRTPGRAELTQEDIDEFNKYKAAKLLPNVVWDWDIGKPVCVGLTGDREVWREDESKRWRLGSVYVRGMISGMWTGVQFTMSLNILTDMLAQPQWSPHYSEITSMSARPLLMRLTEHGFVRTPSSQTSTSSIPHAPPAMMSITFNTPKGPQRAVVPIDVSLGNAWFPGPPGSLKWTNDGEALDAGIFEDRFTGPPPSHESREKEKMGSTQFIVPTPHFYSPRSSPSSSEQDEERVVESGPIDSATLARISASGTAKVFKYETYEEGRESVHERMEGARDRGKLCRYDGMTTERHPGCLQCREREAFLEEERAGGSKKVTVGRGRGVERGGREYHAGPGGGERSRVRVEEIFKSVGMGKKGGEDEEVEELVDLNLEDQDEEEEDDDEDEDEDEEMEDEDEDEDEQDDIPPPSDADSDADSDYEYSSSKPPVDRVRRSHDRYRVEGCHQVEDVVITGGLDEQQTRAWCKNVYYGRVRPWDGLIAILRVSYARDLKPIGYMVYYGYIYGGNTFVGNWRNAGVSDPLVPAFESAFVMSKREE